MDVSQSLGETILTGKHLQMSGHQDEALIETLLIFSLLKMSGVLPAMLEIETPVNR